MCYMGKWKPCSRSSVADLGWGSWNGPRGTHQRLAMWVWHRWLVSSPEHVPGWFIQLCQSMSMCDTVNQHFLLRLGFSNQRASQSNWKVWLRFFTCLVVVSNKVSQSEWFGITQWTSQISDSLVLIYVFILEVGIWSWTADCQFEQHRETHRKLRADGTDGLLQTQRCEIPAPLKIHNILLTDLY